MVTEGFLAWSLKVFPLTMVGPPATGAWFCCIDGLSFTEEIEGDWPCCGVDLVDGVVSPARAWSFTANDFLVALAYDRGAVGAVAGATGDVLPLAVPVVVWGVFSFWGFDVIRLGFSVS